MPRAALPLPLLSGGYQGARGWGVTKSPSSLPSQGGKCEGAGPTQGPPYRNLGSSALAPEHAQVPALGHPLFCWFFLCFVFIFFPVSLWELGCAHSRGARSRRRGRGPRYSLAVAPSHRPTWMYAIFARAHSLRPGHGVATAPLPSPVRRGGTASQQDISGRPGGPRRDWRG